MADKENLVQLVQQWRDAQRLNSGQTSVVFGQCASELEAWLRDPAAQDTRLVEWLETHPYTAFGPGITRDDEGRITGIEPPWEIECYDQHPPHNLGAVHHGQIPRAILRQRLTDTPLNFLHHIA